MSVRERTVRPGARHYDQSIAFGMSRRSFWRSTRFSPTGVPMSLSTTATVDDLARTQDLSGSLADNTGPLNRVVSWGAIAADAAAAALLSPDKP